MEPITTNLVTALSKPSVGMAGSGMSVSAYILHLCGIIGTVAGAIGAVLGCIVAILHIWYFWKNKIAKRDVDPGDL